MSRHILKYIFYDPKLFPHNEKTSSFALFVKVSCIPALSYFVADNVLKLLIIVPPPTQMEGMCYCIQFVSCWGLNPGLCLLGRHLSTELHPQPWLCLLRCTFLFLKKIDSSGICIMVLGIQLCIWMVFKFCSDLYILNLSWRNGVKNITF